MTASADQLPLLIAGVLLIAFLYSSVGHAGASGYIAVLALGAVPPQVIKPTALALNVLVATIGTLQFIRAGHFSWRCFWPFALLSVPLAFVGGYITLPTRALRVMVGAVLLLSAGRLLLRPPPDVDGNPPRYGTALATGGGIGLLAGLTGTGGGIFLTPLLLFRRWAGARVAAAVSAAFVLVNSISGLIGNLTATRSFPTPALALLVAAGLGGALGSYLGSQRLPTLQIKRLLAVVLIIAGLKLVWGQ